MNRIEIPVNLVQLILEQQLSNAYRVREGSFKGICLQFATSMRILQQEIIVAPFSIHIGSSGTH